MLGKRQKSKNEDWLMAMAAIESYVTREQIEKLTAAAVGDIEKCVAGKQSAYAYSGGKDSIVLGHICRQAGVTDSMIGLCDLEYPAFLKWVNSNKPEGCEIINTGQDIAWLAEHPWMLFPEKSGVANRWFSIVQHTAQRRYCHEHEVDILLLGRRKADGNFVGRGTNMYADSKGTTRFSPLAEWRHVDVLAYIHYNALSLPPIYGWHNGYKCGTHPWPARQWTHGNGWAEIYAIDPTIIEKAAEHIPAASDFLEGVRGHE